MYTWIWRHLPGGTPLKAIEALVLMLAVSALLLFVVFPRGRAAAALHRRHGHPLTRAARGSGGRPAQEEFAQQVHRHRDGAVPHRRP